MNRHPKIGDRVIMIDSPWKWTTGTVKEEVVSPKKWRVQLDVDGVECWVAVEEHQIKILEDKQSE